MMYAFAESTNIHNDNKKKLQPALDIDCYTQISYIEERCLKFYSLRVFCDDFFFVSLFQSLHIQSNMLQPMAIGARDIELES